MLHVPVLIIGAGPAGATAAIALARYGVASLLVERRTQLSALPRATGISTRSMELLRGWGLEERARDGAPEIEWLGWSCDLLAGVASGASWPVGFPTRSQAALVSPTSPACVAQADLERVLLAHLGELVPARVERGTEARLLDAVPGGVQVELRRGGETRIVHAEYVIAADGGAGTTRDVLGIAMHGPGDVDAVTAVQFQAPLWERLGAHRYVVYAVRDGFFVTCGRDDRWVYGYADGGEPDPIAASGWKDLPLRVERTSRVTYSALLAERFRDGRVFLAGDAAHRVTPRGGTGMNIAIHDGFDLGWKLAWVLRGWAGTELLDSYEAERRPVAEHNVARSADPNGSIRDAAVGLHADLCGRIPHVPLAGGGSTLDLLGPGLTVLAGPWDVALPERHGRPPVAEHRLDAITARAVGVPHGGALIVRPDGAPFDALPQRSVQLIPA
jgi:putative polyketide hydroxylase